VRDARCLGTATRPPHPGKRRRRPRAGVAPEAKTPALRPGSLRGSQCEFYADSFLRSLDLDRQGLETRVKASPPITE
jgi:hypothetical protein